MMAKTFVQQPPLPLEIDQGDAGTAAFYVVELVFLDEWLVVEEGVDLTAQGTAALAVDDLDRAEAGSQGLVEEAFDFRQGLAECLADDVQFRGHARRADSRYDEAAAAFFSACCSFFNSSRYGALTSLNLTRTVMPRTETVSCLLPMSSTVPTLSRLLTKTCWPTFNFARSTGSRWGFSASGREICWIARRALSMALAFSRSVPSLD